MTFPSHSSTLAPVFASGGNSTDNDTPQHMSEALGLLLVGFVIATICYGCFLTQAHSYFERFRKDSTAVKAAMAFIIISETGTTVLTTQAIFQWLVIGFGKSNVLYTIPLSIPLYEICSCFTIFVVQCFYVYKIRRLQDGGIVSRVLLIVMNVLSVATLALGLVLACNTFRHRHNKDTLVNAGSRLVSISSSVATSLRDFLIIWALHRCMAASRTGIKETEYAIFKLGRYVLSRGILLCFLNAATVILFLALPQSPLFLGTHLIMSRAYANSFVSFLHSFEPYALSTRSAVMMSLSDMEKGKDGDDSSTISGMNFHIEVVRHSDASPFVNMSHHLPQSPSASTLI